MTSRVYFCRAGDFLAPTNDESREFIRKLGDGEEIALKPLRVRSLAFHKRYWALIGDISVHITEFNISLGEVDAFMPIGSPYDLHTAIKLVTGHCTTQHIKNTPYVLRIPKSTDFASMSAEDWADYYLRVLTAIHERALPQIKDVIIFQELARAAS